MQAFFSLELSVIGEVVGCSPDHVGLLHVLFTKKLLAPMEPTKRINGAIIFWVFELVELGDAGTCT
jgi:hypothetical protein